MECETVHTHTHNDSEQIDMTNDDDDITRLPWQPTGHASEAQ